jgi:hypothetical protein
MIGQVTPGKNARIPDPVTPTKWFSGMRKYWDSLYRRCANSACVRQSRPLRSALPSRTGILLDGRWYCSAQCFAAALAWILIRRADVRLPQRATEHRIPLGLLMISRGELNYEQLQTALEAQQKTERGRLGEWLCDLGFSNERQITVALGVQASCPVLSRAPRSYREWSHLLPVALQTSFKAMPIHFNLATRVLSIAFGEHVDYTLLYTMERMLHCQTQACLMPRSEFIAALEEVKGASHSEEAAFNCGDNVQQMTRIVRSYAERLSAVEVNTGHCGDYTWLRLYSKSNFFDLLFTIG